MSNSPDTPLTDSYESRGEALLRKAPEQFLNLLNAIAPDYSQSVVVAKTVIAVLERENIDWVGSAYCCYAHCLKETGRYHDALSAAEKGKQRGFNLNGAWYYHDANVSSRNFLDDLPGALMSDFTTDLRISTDAVANIKCDALMRG